MADGVEDHYDNLRPSTCPRSEGVAIQIKQFHNHMKRTLITHFGSRASTLLDLACGRGGDLRKWYDAGIKRVVGIDISGREIEEAKTRLANLKLTNVTYEFHKMDVASLGFRVHHTDFDVVTCMFALHYFFKDERSAHHIVRTAAAHLKSGGYFVGIVPDGLHINECIRQGHVYQNSLMRIEAKWKGPPQCFGSAYTMNIIDTVTDGSKALEYLVYSNVLRTIAAKYDLEYVSLESIFPGVEAPGRVFAHVTPPYQGDAAECTKVFAAFAFRKC